MSDLIINPYLHAGGAAATGYIVQDYGTDLEGAWSLRKISNSATNCMRIREDGGNTETDIGFSGDNLDTAAIASHCGANNGYVVTWYDQSGNGNNLTQASTARQPPIYNGSNVRTDSEGNVAMYADGGGSSTGDMLQVSNIISGTGGYSAFLFFEADSGEQGAGNQIIRQWDGSTSTGGGLIITAEPACRYNTYVAIYSESGVLNPHTLTCTLESGGSSFDTKLYINGSLKTRSSGTDGAINFGSSEPFGVFNNSVSGTTGFKGYCSEILIYSSDKSSDRADIESNIDGYWTAT